MRTGSTACGQLLRGQQGGGRTRSTAERCTMSRPGRVGAPRDPRSGLVADVAGGAWALQTLCRPWCVRTRRGRVAGSRGGEFARCPACPLTLESERVLYSLTMSDGQPDV